MNKCKVCSKSSVLLFRESNNNENNIFCGRVCQIKSYYNIIGDGLFDGIPEIKQHGSILFGIIKYLSNEHIIHNLHFMTFCDDMVKILHKILDNKDSIEKVLNTSQDDLYNELLNLSLDFGYERVSLALLLEFKTLKLDNNRIARNTNIYNTKIINILLQDDRFDPSARDNYLIRWASYNGYIEIVKILLDRKSTRLNSSHIQKSRMPSSA